MARTHFRLVCTAVLAFAACAAAARSDETPAGKVIRPFDGRPGFQGWAYKGSKERSKWQVGIATVNKDDNRRLVVDSADSAKTAEMVNEAAGVDIYTDQKFGDCTIELEFMIPKGSNSGVYVMGEYEVQILDSYGKKTVGPGDMGGLYGAAAPKTNACKAPGEWQTFVIEFQAPQFEGGKKVANAKFLKVTLNDQVIHENVEMKGPTPSGITGKEAAMGPLMFQGDHGPVTFRNIKITMK